MPRTRKEEITGIRAASSWRWSTAGRRKGSPERLGRAPLGLGRPPAHHGGRQGTAVDPEEAADLGGGQERGVGDVHQPFRDPPEVGLGDHPSGMDAVEARQVDGAEEARSVRSPRRLM